MLRSVDSTVRPSMRLGNAVAIPTLYSKALHSRVKSDDRGTSY
jgi:hypothetical protein